MSEERVQEEGTRIFSVVPNDRARGNGNYQGSRKFPVNTQKHFFSVRVSEHCHRWPRKAPQSPFLEVFQWLASLKLTSVKLQGKMTSIMLGSSIRFWKESGAW